MSDSDDGGESVFAPPDKASRDYQHLFHLPFDELLVDSFTCALQKGILHQGKLYISQHYLAFYSDILFSKAKLVIRADRIESAALAKVLIFPTAIRVTHDNGTESLFASFLGTRDRACKLINQIAKGERIGKQRVRSAHELDGVEASSAQEAETRAPAPTSLGKSTKHQKLLEQRDGDVTSSPSATGETPPKRSPRPAEDGAKQDSDSRPTSATSRKSGGGGGGGKSARNASSDEESSQAAKAGGGESTLSKLAHLLTSVPIEAVPRPAHNAISTPHGVVVVSDNPRTVLPQGSRFRHVRAPSLARGVDGPAASLALNSSEGSRRTSGGLQRNSPLIRPANGRKLSMRDRDPSPSEEAAEDVPSSSRTKSAQRSVALALKPRTNGARRSRRFDSDEEEEEED